MAILPLFLLAAAGPFTLDAALELASQQNPGVQAARLRVLEREAMAVSAKAAYLPQADVVIGGTRQTRSGSAHRVRGRWRGRRSRRAPAAGRGVARKGGPLHR